MQGLLCATGSDAFAQNDPAHAAQEGQARQKLDQVRVQIKQINAAQKEISIKKSDADAGLREQELKIAAAAKELRALDQKLAAQVEKLDALQSQRAVLEKALRAQRDTLAVLLRSSYMIGRNEELKLLLAQENVSAIGRELAYFRYFEHARIAEIDMLLEDLRQIAVVQSAIDAETEALRATREQRAHDAESLELERSERKQLLAELETQLSDEKSHLATLGKDEKGLVDLLEKLRDVFADIPKQISGAEPFESSKGHLSWPLRGRIAVTFGPKSGGEHENHGIVIAANEGSDVHAVSHGRVVFADWMRGFGLLLIIDHGDGYMTLYGYNETLLKDVGDWVDANDTIASSGVTGGQKTPGVYFELRAQGKPLDPRSWLKP